MKKQVFLFFLVVAMSLFGCTSGIHPASIAPTSNILVSKTPIPQPSSGKASVSGQLVTSSNTPLAATLVRLGEIYGEGKNSIYVVDDSKSPGTYTNKEGFFVFSDVTPGPYAVLFTDNDGNYRSINKAATIVTVDAVENKNTDLGQIKVDLSTPSK